MSPRNRREFLELGLSGLVGASRPVRGVGARAPGPSGNVYHLDAVVQMNR